MEELEQVILTDDLPELRLEEGDLGTVVLVHSEGDSFEVEFITLNGETVVVTTLRENQVRPIEGREMPSARTLV
jgi:hypothetical protein